MRDHDHASKAYHVSRLTFYICQELEVTANVLDFASEKRPKRGYHLGAVCRWQVAGGKFLLQNYLPLATCYLRLKMSRLML